MRSNALFASRGILMRNRYRRTAIAFLFVAMLSSSMIQFNGGSHETMDPAPTRDDPEPVDWIETSSFNWSTYMNSTWEVVIDHSMMNGSLSSISSYFDPYFHHNSTVRNAIDAAPQWLNDTLTWKFHDISWYSSWKYTSLLLDDSIDPRYRDEIAFIIAYLNTDYLDSYWTIPQLLLDNVHMMYHVSSEVSYADIIDTVLPDGNHSTVVYRTPTGNITLPEEIYYWYLAMPRNELEQAAYINTTDFIETIDPEEGHFWREFLYTANDTGFPVLRDLLLNQTTLWNGTRNQVQGNGAVGAVTDWGSRVMEFRFEETMRRDHQPVSLYEQHFGLCGENGEVLVAAAKTALIPTVSVINFDAMHAWNEFYERGWHQWEGYSHQIDNPQAEGGPGSMTVTSSLNPDQSFFTNIDLYTPTSDLTVNVFDRNGVPVDGAMVKIRSQPSTNFRGAYPLLGNATDVNGGTTFKVGANFGYFIQVLSPIDGWLPESAELPMAFPTTAPGQNHTFNVTLDTQMPLRANLSALYRDPGYGVRFNVTADDLVHQTRFHRDPWGYFFHIEKGYSDRTRLDVFFLDDENLSLYRNGQEFFPGAVLNLSMGDEGSVILDDAKDWHIVVPGMARPLTRSYISFHVTAFRSVVTPVASIISPEAGTYLVGEQIQFKGSLEPAPMYIGPLSYEWILDGDAEPLSTENEFNTVLPWGDNSIIFNVYNSTGLIDSDSVDIDVVHPNRHPTAIITGSIDGMVLESGTRVTLSAIDSFDPDNDTLSFEWRDESDRSIISETPYIDQYFRSGNHSISVNVSDGKDLWDKAFISFSILEPNLPPIPHIESPLSWSQFREDEWIHLSANGSYDMEMDNISFRWESSIDGNISYLKEDNVLLSPGSHQLFLWVDDGDLSASTFVQFHVIERTVIENREPIANIYSPSNGENYYIDQWITLSSIGSYDPDGVNLTFRWEVDSRIISTAPNHTILLSEGVHTIGLTVSDGVLSGSMTVIIVVTDRYPILSLKINGTEMNETDEVQVIEMENITLDASASIDPDGYMLEFQWFLGDDLISSSDMFTRSFEAGIYYLRLVVTDISGRTISKQVLLRVLADQRPIPNDGSDDNRGSEEGIPIIWYIIPIAIILISVIVILFMARKRGEEEYYLEE